MSLVDVFIALLLLGACFRGMALGLVHQVFSTIGFFLGLYLGTLIEPHVVVLSHDQISRIVLTIVILFGSGLLFLSIGEVIGMLLKKKLQLQRWVNRIDNTLGAMLSALSVLVLVWITAAVLVVLPYPNVQSIAKDSQIVAILDHTLPPTPDIVADIGHIIAPNGFPDVFIGLEPPPTPVTQPTPADLAAAVAKDRGSIVKIQGSGCGGIVSGSGFVVGNGLVATNAHVVAGIRSPYIILPTGKHLATAIWFDPDLDFAVLRATGVSGDALTFNTNSAARGTAGGVLGFPGGGSFEADSAAVLDEFTAVGRNIYGQGKTTRDVYSIQATVVPGNSGGPLVNTFGDVIGMVFATSTQYNNLGYVLSSKQLVTEINQARAANTPVSTGTCAE